jgi:hypothetical protein
MSTNTLFESGGINHKSQTHEKRNVKLAILVGIEDALNPRNSSTPNYSGSIYPRVYLYHQLAIDGIRHG